jgi:hypothetical protein
MFGLEDHVNLAAASLEAVWQDQQGDAAPLNRQ